MKLILFQNVIKIIILRRLNFEKMLILAGVQVLFRKRNLKQMRFAANYFAHKNNLQNVNLYLAGAIVEGEDFEKFNWFKILD